MGGRARERASRYPLPSPREERPPLPARSYASRRGAGGKLLRSRATATGREEKTDPYSTSNPGPLPSPRRLTSRNVNAVRPPMVLRRGGAGRGEKRGARQKGDERLNVCRDLAGFKPGQRTRTVRQGNDAIEGGLGERPRRGTLHCTPHTSLNPVALRHCMTSLHDVDVLTWG